MAEVLRRGQPTGVHVTPFQWCNDWVSIKEGPDIYRPTRLKLTPEEQIRFQASFDAGRAGFMPAEFELQPDGRFVSRLARRKRSPVRS